jgi:hypothetical protein
MLTLIFFSFVSSLGLSDQDDSEIFAKILFFTALGWLPCESDREGVVSVGLLTIGDEREVRVLVFYTCRTRVDEQSIKRKKDESR